MKKATLLHNPKAGDKSYTKKELMSLLESQGVKCMYSSIKIDGWDDIHPKTAFIIIAGGDGTVRKVAEKLWENGQNAKYEIALFPAGTANNIAKTLDIAGNDEEIIKSWEKKIVRKLDAGKISNLGKSRFFLESFGLGIFPHLMKEMKQKDENGKDSPEKKLEGALNLLNQLMESYRPFYCEIEIDGKEYTGKYLMVEIMNTQSIGPNLIFSPNANTADGEFEVVLISEDQKEKFRSYISEKLQGSENPAPFDTLRAKKILIKCKNYLAHSDDELIEVKDISTVEIEVMKSFLKFLV